MWRVCVLAFLWLLSARPALAVEQLRWAILPTPGVANLRDGQPQDGIAFDFLRLLEPSLVDVQVTYQVSNLPRVQHDMAQGRNLCAVLYVRSPARDQIGYFIPLLLTPPLQVVVRAADAGRLPLRDGRLWMNELFAAPLRGGFFIQRNHPPTLQARLAQGLEQNRLVGVNMAANGDRALQMLSHGPFDYTFEYPTTLTSFARANPQLAPLRSVPLADIPELPVVGGYCTRNEWGRAMAMRIDGAVRAVMAAPQSLEALYRHWLPAESYQAYSAEIQAFLHQRGSQHTSFASP